MRKTRRLAGTGWVVGDGIAYVENASHAELS